MMDLMALDAASWDATPVHDLYFEDDPNLDVVARPNQFSKWLIEKDHRIDVTEASLGKSFCTPTDQTD